MVQRKIYDLPRMNLTKIETTKTNYIMQQENIEPPYKKEGACEMLCSAALDDDISSTIVIVICLVNFLLAYFMVINTCSLPTFMTLMQF